MKKMMVLPEYMVFGMGIACFVFAILYFSTISRIRSNPLAKTALDAEKEGRIGLIHYPSGNVEAVIPELEPDMGKQSPTWNLGGTKRFKDFSGDKWEQCGRLKIIHYTTRQPAPISTTQAVAVDQFEEHLAGAGFNITGIRKEVFELIAEASKGQEALRNAWKNMGVTGHLNKETRTRIKGVLKYLANNPDFKLTMFKSGAFTYQTVVHLIDQVVGDSVSELSDVISHTEDRVRRQGQSQVSDFMKYLPWIITIVMVCAIAATMIIVVVQSTSGVPGISI